MKLLLWLARLALLAEVLRVEGERRSDGFVHRSSVGGRTRLEKPKIDPAHNSIESFF